jgi:hypothetical protein
MTRVNIYLLWLLTNNRYLEAYWSGVVFLWSHLAMALTLAAMLVYHQWSGRHVGQTSTSVVLLSVYWVVRLLSNTSLLVVLQSADSTSFVLDLES